IPHCNRCEIASSSRAVSDSGREKVPKEKRPLLPRDSKTKEPSDPLTNRVWKRPLFAPLPHICSVLLRPPWPYFLQSSHSSFRKLLTAFWIAVDVPIR